jgi:hypothetical protein
MPALVLSLLFIASWSRYMRASLSDVLAMNYVNVARAKGVSGSDVVFRHAVRNAAIPVLTVIALNLPALFTGSIITETIFAWPGMGRLFYDGLLRQDYTRLMGIIFIASFLIAILNLQYIVRTGAEQAADGTKTDTRGVIHRHADQIAPVVLIQTGRGQRFAWGSNVHANDAFRRSAISHADQRCNDAFAVRLATTQFVRLPSRIRCIRVRTKPPLRHRAPRQGIIPESVDPEPALNAERVRNAAEDNHRRMLPDFNQAEAFAPLTRRATVGDSCAPLVCQ